MKRAIRFFGFERKKGQEDCGRSTLIQSWKKERCLRKSLREKEKKGRTGSPKMRRIDRIGASSNQGGGEGASASFTSKTQVVGGAGLLTRSRTGPWDGKKGRGGQRNARSGRRREIRQSKRDKTRNEKREDDYAKTFVGGGGTDRPSKRVRNQTIGVKGDVPRHKILTLNTPEGVGKKAFLGGGGK